MTARTKRNIANILVLLGISPVLTWMILAGMALGGLFLPWISAGILLCGIYLLFLSICISGPALLWSRSQKVRYPDLWTKLHRFPAAVAQLVLLMGGGLNVGLWAWEQLHPSSQPLAPMTLPAEEHYRIQDQIGRKIQEVEGLRR